MKLRERLDEPFPKGWIPRVGECVIVPSKGGKSHRAYRADVIKVVVDIVTVRTRMVRGPQQYLLRDIRPNNR